MSRRDRTLRRRIVLLAFVSVLSVAAGVGYASFSYPVARGAAATALGPAYGRIGLIPLAEAGGADHRSRMPIVVTRQSAHRIKRRVGSARGPVRLHVLDLDTRALTPLAETRSVDDQVEWLDDNRILYALPDGDGGSTIWVAPADGSGAAVPFTHNAYSPAVIR